MDTGSTGPLVASPSLLPATGIGAAGPDVRVGNLGGLSRAAGVRPQPGGGRAWTITPQIGVSEEYTNGNSGVRVAGSGRSSSEFISSLQPSIAINGDTTRLRGDLFYTPNIEFYVPDGSQNRIEQNFNGRLLATLLPQTVFLDLRASGSIQPITAGQAPVGTTSLSRADSTQSYNFSASPYALHRFGPWGTAEVGGNLARSSQSALQSASSQTQTQAQAALADLDAANQDTTIYGGHLAFTTGEALGRYNGAALAQATRFDGSGVLSGAYRDTVTLDSGYAVTRSITALATGGYEQIHYAGTSPIHISDEIWNVGVRLTPNADSSLTLRYGHQDGLNSVLIDAAYQATARLRLYGRYSTGLTTQTEQLQNALATSDIDSLGNSVDHATGAPLVAVGNFFGTQNSLFRTSQASLTATLVLDRDSITASINSQNQRLISASTATFLAAGNANGVGVGATQGVYGSLSWSHELRPNIQSTLYGQYGVSKSDGSSTTEHLIVISAALSYALTKTLSGHVQYSYNRNSGSSLASGGVTTLNNTSIAGTNGSQSLALVSLVKSF